MIPKVYKFEQVLFTLESFSLAGFSQACAWFFLKCSQKLLKFVNLKPVKLAFFIVGWLLIFLQEKLKILLVFFFPSFSIEADMFNKTFASGNQTLLVLSSLFFNRSKDLV